MPSSQSPASPRETLADPGLHRALAEMIRSRVPSSEVDDIVQATLTEALAASAPPQEREALRRWVFGIARHKIADHYRKNRREYLDPDLEAEAPSAPHGAKDLLRWAERELPDDDQAKETLDWMLREGDGEKLETIANNDQVPAPRVRQRVSRWRRELRARWVAQLAAVAAVALVLGAAIWALRRKPEPITLGPDRSAVPPVESPLQRAAKLRAVAFQQCEAKQWQDCLSSFDRAAQLDPAGDAADPVVQARKQAQDALAPSPAPSAPEPAPSSQAPSPAPSSNPAPTRFMKKEGPMPVPPQKPAPTQAPLPNDSLTPQQQNNNNSELYDAPTQRRTAPPKSKKAAPSKGDYYDPSSK